MLVNVPAFFLFPQCFLSLHHFSFTLNVFYPLKTFFGILGTMNDKMTSWQNGFMTKKSANAFNTSFFVIWGKVYPLPGYRVLPLSKLKAFTDDNFTGAQIVQCWKRRKCWLPITNII